MGRLRLLSGPVLERLDPPVDASDKLGVGFVRGAFDNREGAPQTRFIPGDARRFVPLRIVSPCYPQSGPARHVYPPILESEAHE